MTEPAVGGFRAQVVGVDDAGEPDAGAGVCRACLAHLYFGGSVAGVLSFSELM
jgi:hypothetical protein